MRRPARRTRRGGPRLPTRSAGLVNDYRVVFIVDCPLSALVSKRIPTVDPSRKGVSQGLSPRRAKPARSATACEARLSGCVQSCSDSMPCSSCAQRTTARTASVVKPCPRADGDSMYPTLPPSRSATDTDPRYTSPDPAIANVRSSDSLQARSTDARNLRASCSPYGIDTSGMKRGTSGSWHARTIAGTSSRRGRRRTRRSVRISNSANCRSAYGRSSHDPWSAPASSRLSRLHDDFGDRGFERRSWQRAVGGRAAGGRGLSVRRRFGRRAHDHRLRAHARARGNPTHASVSLRQPDEIRPVPWPPWPS